MVILVTFDKLFNDENAYELICDLWTTDIDSAYVLAKPGGIYEKVLAGLDVEDDVQRIGTLHGIKHISDEFHELKKTNFQNYFYEQEGSSLIKKMRKIMKNPNEVVTLFFDELNDLKCVFKRLRPNIQKKDIDGTIVYVLDEVGTRNAAHIMEEEYENYFLEQEFPLTVESDDDDDLEHDEWYAE